MKLFLSLSKLSNLKGKCDSLFSLDISIPTHSLSSSLHTLTQTNLQSYSVLTLKVCVHTDNSRTILAEDQLSKNQPGVCLGWKKEEYLLSLHSVCCCVLANEMYLKVILTRRVYKVRGLFYLM